MGGLIPTVSPLGLRTRLLPLQGRATVLLQCKDLCATVGGRYLLIAVILQDAAPGSSDVTDDVTLRKGNRSAPLARVSDR